MKKSLSACLLLACIMIAPGCWRRKKVVEEDTVIIEHPVRGSGPAHWGITDDELDEIEEDIK